MPRCVRGYLNVTVTETVAVFPPLTVVHVTTAEPDPTAVINPEGFTFATLALEER